MSEKQLGEFIFDLMRKEPENLGFAKEDEVWENVDSDSRQILRKVETAIRANEREKVRAECVGIADEYNAPDRFKVSDEWRAELTPSEVYNAGATDAAIWIAAAIRALGDKP